MTYSAALRLNFPDSREGGFGGMRSSIQCNASSYLSRQQGMRVWRYAFIYTVQRFVLSLQITRDEEVEVCVHTYSAALRLISLDSRGGEYGGMRSYIPCRASSYLSRQPGRRMWRYAFIHVVSRFVLSLQTAGEEGVEVCVHTYSVALRLISSDSRGRGCRGIRSYIQCRASSYLFRQPW